MTLGGCWTGSSHRNLKSRRCAISVRAKKKQAELSTLIKNKDRTLYLLKRDTKEWLQWKMQLPKIYASLQTLQKENDNIRNVLHKEAKERKKSFKPQGKESITIDGQIPVVISCQASPSLTVGFRYFWATVNAETRERSGQSQQMMDRFFRDVVAVPQSKTL